MAAKKTTKRSTTTKKPAARTVKKKAAPKMSQLDAAVQVLRSAKGPMNCKDMVEVMLAKKLWSTNGRTPSATLYSAILRGIQSKGKSARFKKIDRGRFALK